jgi:hypothetical protein
MFSYILFFSYVLKITGCYLYLDIHYSSKIIEAQDSYKMRIILYYENNKDIFDVCGFFDGGSKILNQFVASVEFA